jgi:hypothetical protein
MLQYPYYNPGNLERVFDKSGKELMFDGQKQSLEGSQFRCFINIECGYRALIKQILFMYARGLKTIAEIIETFAPINDNNPTEQYIANVSCWMNISRDVSLVITKELLINFAASISRQENGQLANLSEIEAGFDLL